MSETCASCGRPAPAAEDPDHRLWSITADASGPRMLCPDCTPELDPLARADAPLSDRLAWKRGGNGYYCALDGSVVALLYPTGPGVQGAEIFEEWTAPRAWWCVLTTDAERPVVVEAPGPYVGMPKDEWLTCRRLAVQAASKLVADRLNPLGSDD